MFHMFDTEVAAKYGVNAAIIFQTIAFWCDHSRTNGTNFHDGHYWTYNSVKAFGEQFNYLGKRQIQNALQTLLDEGVIIKGNYNKLAYDRTMWYALTEKGNSMFTKWENGFTQNGKMDLPKEENGNTRNGQTNTLYTPDIGIDIYTAHKPDVDKTIPGFDEFYAEYPRKVSKPNAQKAWAKLKPDEELRKTILADIQRRKGGEWAGKDRAQFIPYPATYLNQRRWEDEPEDCTQDTDDGYAPTYFERFRDRLKDAGRI